MTAPAPFDAETLAEAQRYCATLAHEHARDDWLGALYAPAACRDGLLALAAFDHEIHQARARARDANLAAIRLAWWREAALGAREGEAAGNPVALALRAAIAAFALPAAAIEAMLDARLTEVAPPQGFTLAAFEAYAAESEGARLSLAARIASERRDLDTAEASAPAGLALALTRTLIGLGRTPEGGPTLFPVDVAERHGAASADFAARRATAGALAACAEMRALARERLAEAESRLKRSLPSILPAFIGLGALRLDLDRLDRGAARPFEPVGEVSAFRRQWAIWRWARRF